MNPFKALVFTFTLSLLFSPALSSAKEQGTLPNSKQDEFALARKVLRDTVRIGVKIKEPQYRGFVLELASVFQAKVDDFTGALETVTKIPNPDRAALVLADIAFIQTTKGYTQQGAGTYRQAHARAAVLKDQHTKALMLGKIAELEAKSHMANASETFAEALQIASGLSVNQKPDVLFRLGSYQVGAGLEAVETLKQASQALSLISDNFGKWITAFQLAPLQVQVGDHQGALITARLCTDEADRYFQSTVLRSVAAAQAQNGMLVEAVQTSSEITNELIREESLEAIVKAHLKNGDLQEASRLTETIHHASVTKTLSLIHIAAAHATAGNADEADRGLTEALNVFERGVLDQPEQFDFMQLSVVNTLIEAGQLQKATNAAHIIRLPPVQVLALAHVAEAWAKSGDRMRAMRLVTQAVEKAGTSGNSLARVAQSYAQLGEIPSALKIAKKISHEFDRAEAYERIADIQTQRGEAKKVLDWAGGLRSPYLQSWALLGITLGILQKHGIDVRTSVL